MSANIDIDLITLEVIRKPYGRIAFGHSELSGRQSWGRAGKEAQRAVEQILTITT